MQTSSGRISIYFIKTQRNVLKKKNHLVIGFKEFNHFFHVVSVESLHYMSKSYHWNLSEKLNCKWRLTFLPQHIRKTLSSCHQQGIPLQLYSQWYMSYPNQILHPEENAHGNKKIITKWLRYSHMNEDVSL